MTRDIAAAILIVTVAALAVVAIARPEVSEHVIEIGHVVAWILGALDVLIVGALLLIESGGK